MCLLSCPGVRFNSGAAITSLTFLEEDLARLTGSKVKMVLSCLCESELKLGVGRYTDAFAKYGISWKLVPIPDMTPPSSAHDIALVAALSSAKPLLATGHPLGIHCMAGLGRTGTVAARFAMSYGLSALEAIQFIRDRHDKSAIETSEQEAYLIGLQSSTARAS